MQKPEEPGPKQRVIRAEIATSATPEQVWAAWTDPEKIAQWFVDRAEGQPVPGTIYTWVWEKFGYEFPYEVIEAVAGEKLVLGGQAPGRPPFRLEITIRREAGETRVTLVNSGFLEGAEWDDEFEGIASGWRKSLAILKIYLEQHFGRPKTTALALRPARFDYAHLHPFLATSKGLSRWLARSAETGEAGERYAIELRGGGRASGRVLLANVREAAMTWEEIGGVLELFAFAAGPGRRMIGLRAIGWELTTEHSRGIEALFEAALDRLLRLLPESGVVEESRRNPVPEAARKES